LHAPRELGVIVHAYDQEGCARRRPRHEREPLEPSRAEHRFVEDDDIRRDAIEEADERRQVGGGADRLDPLFAAEGAQQRRADPVVAGGDQDGDGPMERYGLDGHEEKDRRVAVSSHPRPGLNRRP